jgi:hypothetical protein
VNVTTLPTATNIQYSPMGPAWLETRWSSDQNNILTLNKYWITNFRNLRTLLGYKKSNILNILYTVLGPPQVMLFTDIQSSNMPLFLLDDIIIVDICDGIRTMQTHYEMRLDIMYIHIFVSYNR